MHAFLIHCSLVIFLLCFPHDPCFFCAAMMTRTYISRCWDFVQGPKFDELCACLSQCTFIHCVSSMILICCPWCIHSELGLNFVLLVHVWWQFVYQMMLLDACFFCFLDSSNRSSCSRPIYRTVLDGVWHCKKKKNPLCQNECLNLLNRSWLFWSILPVLCYCHVIMVINTIIAVLNYQISTSKIANGKQSLSSIELPYMNLYVGTICRKELV